MPMLLPDNIHPENSVYYNGAFVLRAIRENTPQDVVNLYLHTRKFKDMTMSVFVLCLDWLFLLDLVVINDKGRVELCT